MYFVDVPLFYIEALNEKVYNPFRYFKFENIDEWFRTDFARPMKNNFSYYPYLEKYLNKEFNLYLRKQKLNKLNVL
jgi:hypothetical protein